MTDERIHRAVSADGTEIAGRVRGQGPPLVLVHAPPHDADLAWTALLPRLEDRVTCFMPDLRGRGVSGDSPDHSVPRFQEDVTAFVDSIGEPVCLLGWSDGGTLALGAAERSPAVTAVAAHEPAVWSLMPEQDRAALGVAVQRQMEATAAGRLAEAAEVFHRFVCTEQELAALDPGYLERQSRLFPLIVQEIAQRSFGEGPEPTDSDELARITAPVLVLLTGRSRLGTWFTDSARHVARHVPTARVEELPDVGHFAPLVAPDPVAAEVLRFVAAVSQPA